EGLLKNLLNRCVHRVLVNGFELSKIEHNACLYFPQRSWARPTAIKTQASDIGYYTHTRHIPPNQG
ncbi:MAG: hypothetical protein ACR2PX_17915, partial [Endozoicomonas sp.]|uniref:hypothetical protein n=1 Tax=Endozoicomonas sp. TaxID=1892382 RepID=UPI003D9B89AF